MNKEEAAQYLGVSVRSLERFTQQNRVACRIERGKTKPTPIYDEEELQRFKAELEKATHRPSLQPASDENRISPDHDSRGFSLARLADSSTLERIINATAQATAQAMMLTAPEVPPQATEKPSVNVADKLLLTLSESQALTGLSRGVLRSAIDARKLKAQVIGRAFRIKRSDLDAYIGKL